MTRSHGRPAPGPARRLWPVGGAPCMAKYSQRTGIHVSVEAQKKKKKSRAARCVRKRRWRFPHRAEALNTRRNIRPARSQIASRRKGRRLHAFAIDDAAASSAQAPPGVGHDRCASGASAAAPVLILTPEKEPPCATCLYEHTIKILSRTSRRGGRGPHTWRDQSDWSGARASTAASGAGRASCSPTWCCGLSCPSSTAPIHPAISSAIEVPLIVLSMYAEREYVRVRSRGRRRLCRQALGGQGSGRRHSRRARRQLISAAVADVVDRRYAAMRG